MGDRPAGPACGADVGRVVRAPSRWPTVKVGRFAAAQGVVVCAADAIQLYRPAVAFYVREVRWAG